MKNKSFMYRDCVACKDKKIQTNNIDGCQVTWNVWKNIRVKVEKKTVSESKKQFTNRIVKERESGSIEILVEELQKDICRHIYNIQHQYKVFKTLIENQDDRSAVVHIDFSENYACKYGSEMQSIHFGAPQRQASVHTSMAYI